jgi:ribose 5-phosphate isomerase A
MKLRANLKTADEIWGREIINSKQKEQVALQLAKRLNKGDVVGVGSGSTSFMTIKALAARRDKEALDFWAIPASIEMELVCGALEVPTVSLLTKSPDWSFDGADEVDNNGSLIKGRGGAMLREKILMRTCPEVYIVVDKSKLVKRLGQNFPVPVEIHPEALAVVMKDLKELSGVTKTTLRQAVAKDGPVITENGNLIVDVSFSKIANDMEVKLKAIVGVVESGLFIGYKSKIILAD